MTNQLFPTPPRAFDRNGEPLGAAKAYIYRTGTMTAVTVTDAAATPLAWPVVADINGTFPQMFYAGTYDLKLIITDSADVVQPGYPLDPVAMASSDATEAVNIAFDPTAEAPSLNVQAAIEDLSTEIGTLKAISINATGLVQGGGTLTSDMDIFVDIATNAQAIAGLSNTTAMTPLRTAAAIVALAPAAVSIPLATAFLSSDQTITSSGLLTLAHSLGAVPEAMAFYLVCQTGEANWTAGDVIWTDVNSSNGSWNRVNVAYVDATNVYIRFTDDASCFTIGDKTTGASFDATNANWKLRVRAWA